MELLPTARRSRSSRRLAKHVYRLFTDFEIILGSHTIPMWVSYVGIVVAGGLSIGLFRESR